MQVINWKALQVTEQDLMKAVRSANDEREFLKQIVVALLKQWDNWGHKSDSVELFNLHCCYNVWQVIATP